VHPHNGEDPFTPVLIRAIRVIRGCSSIFRVTFRRILRITPVNGQKGLLKTRNQRRPKQQKEISL
jgi:hypothetical protein